MSSIIIKFINECSNYNIGHKNSYKWLMMVEIKIGIQKIKKMGTFSYLTVPKAIVESGMIDESEQYLVVLIPQKQKADQKPEVSQ